MKRLIAFFLTLALLVSCVPAALAAETEMPEGTLALLDEYETTEETTEATEEPTEETTEATEATEEVTEAPTEATEAAAEATEATEVTEAPTEATEETTAATEETTEATTEATTEETSALFDEEEPEEEPEAEGQTGKSWDYDANVYWCFDSASKLYISWNAKEGAASYALYEVVYQKNGLWTEKKIGTTNTTEITIKAPKEWHGYWIYPCSAPNGKGERGDALYFGDYFPAQDWRKAPKLTVKQYAGWENWVEVKCNSVPGAEGYLLIVDGAEYEYDADGNRIGNYEIESDELRIKTKESVNKKGSTSIYMYAPTKGEDKLSTYMSEVSCTAWGTVDSDGMMEYGSGSKTTKVKMTPQWLKAPKLSVEQSSAVEPEVTLTVSFSGEPDYIRFYDGKDILGDVPVDEDETGFDVTYRLSAGSHSFKAVPIVEDRGFYKGGKASSAKKLNVKISWKTDKIKVTAREVEAGKVSLDWVPMNGVYRYEIWRKVGKLAAEQIGDVSANYVDDIPVEKGVKYTFTVKPVYNGEAGKGGSVSITPKKSKPDYSNRTYRALLIGNTYPDGVNNPLPGCEQDANSMEKMLKSMNQTPYKVTKKIDVTANKILSSISTAFSGAKDSDVSLFYYSGHGAGGTGSLVGADDKDVTFAQLRAALDKIPGDKIVILDSCYSGNAINKSSTKSSTGSQTDMEAYVDAAMEAFANDAAKSGELARSKYYVITACRKDQVSEELGVGVGLFTYWFERACGWDELNDCRFDMLGDANRDGMITFSEAYQKTYSMVKEYVDKYYPGGQVTRANPESSSFVLFGRK